MMIYLGTELYKNVYIKYYHYSHDIICVFTDNDKNGTYRYDLYKKYDNEFRWMKKLNIPKLKEHKEKMIYIPAFYSSSAKSCLYMMNKITTNLYAEL